MADRIEVLSTIGCRRSGKVRTDRSVGEDSDTTPLVSERQVRLDELLEAWPTFESRQGMWAHCRQS